MAKICPVCNEYNHDDAIVCLRCSSSLSEAAPAAAAAPEAVGVEPTGGKLELALAGKYKLEQQLGAGEHTEVYAALSVRKTARRFALKCYHTNGEAERFMVSGLFQRAAKVRELAHQNIVKTYGCALEKDHYIVLMELAEGMDAATYLKKFGSLPEYEVWETAQAALKALAYAHGQGVIHGDVKPANLFLPLAPETPVRLSDFGLGAPGWNSTTAIYAAPELLKGQTSEPRSDQYSLGIVLFELLTGKPPFVITTSADSRSLQRSRLNRSLLATFPEPLRTLLDRLLRRDPAERFATAAEALHYTVQQQGQQLSHSRPETREAPGSDERKARVLLAQAEQAKAAQRLDEAKELLAQATQSNPHDLEIKAKYDEISQLIRQRQLAQNELQQGLQWLQEQRTEDAVRILSHAEKLDPASSEIAAAMQRARQLHARRQADKNDMSASLKTIVAEPPTSPPSRPPVAPAPAPRAAASVALAPPKPPERPRAVAPPTPKPASHSWHWFAVLSVVFLLIITALGWYLWRPRDHRSPAASGSTAAALPNLIVLDAGEAPALPGAGHASAALDAGHAPEASGGGHVSAPLSVNHASEAPNRPLKPAAPTVAAAVVQPNLAAPLAPLPEMAFGITALPPLAAPAATPVPAPAKPTPIPARAQPSPAPLARLEDFPNSRGAVAPASAAMLVFKTQPPNQKASVFLDGKELGATPLTHSGLAAGRHYGYFRSLQTGEEDGFNLYVADKEQVYYVTLQYAPPTPEKPPESKIPPAPPDAFDDSKKKPDKDDKK